MLDGAGWICWVSCKHMGQMGSYFGLDSVLLFWFVPVALDGLSVVFELSIWLYHFSGVFGCSGFFWFLLMVTVGGAGCFVCWVTCSRAFLWVCCVGQVSGGDSCIVVLAHTGRSGFLIQPVW